MKFNPKKKSGMLIFVTIFFLFSTSIAIEGKGNKELEKLKAFKAAYPNTSKDYRGVVAIDVNNGGIDEIIADFGSNGLWIYSGIWLKLNQTDPDWIIGFEHSSTQYLLCDFGAAGLWYWYYNGSWSGQFVKITAADPDNIAFVSDYDGDGDDEVFLTFGADGLWVYDMGAATVLTKLHATNPNMDNSLKSGLKGLGYEEGALDYNAQGLWTYYGPGRWTKLSASSPYDDNASANVNNEDAAEELIIDFGVNGLWVYEETGTSWYKISSYIVQDLIPVRFEGVPDYEILACFQSVSGLYWWNHGGYPGTWSKISNTTPDYDGGFCEPYDPNGISEGNGDQEVAVDFGSLGLWQFDYTDYSWTKLSSNNPEFMVKCDYYSDGYNTALVVDFGASIGLWMWDGRDGAWHKLSDFSPDGVN